MVVVPRMSLPIFIPDINSSFLDSFGLFMWTSYKADDIAIDVSIMLPIRPIIIIEFDRANMFIPMSYIT